MHAQYQPRHEDQARRLSHWGNEGLRGRNLPGSWVNSVLQGRPGDSRMAQGKNQGLRPLADIDELERRITAALDRIGKGVETLERPADNAADELERLKSELEDERTANAQLEQRVKAIKDKQDIRLAELDSQSKQNSEAMERLDAELQRLRKANDSLRDTSAALREANEKGVGEPHLINKAMLAELEALRAARSADVAEADAILTAMEPLLAEAANAAVNEETA